MGRDLQRTETECQLRAEREELGGHVRGIKGVFKILLY